MGRVKFRHKAYYTTLDRGSQGYGMQQIKRTESEKTGECRRATRARAQIHRLACEGGGLRMKTVRRTMHGNAEPSSPINLNLVVRNFGPVAHADINIKPLTILIGPNNSGKSYVAMLLQSILEAQSRVAGARLRGRGVIKYSRSILRKKYEQNKYKMVITKLESRKIRSALLDEWMGPDIKRQIVKDFGSDMRDLVRTGKKVSSVEVSECDPSTGETLKLSIKLGEGVSVRTTAKAASYIAEAVPGSRYYHVNTDELPKSQSDTDQHVNNVLQELPDKRHFSDAVVGMDPDILCASCARDVTGMVLNQLQFKTVPNNIYYFPAARSGILQGHKALSASIVAHAPYGGIQPIEIPQVTGVIADFISRIILLRRMKAPFSTIARDMENDLFGGNIELDVHTKNEYPEIVYRANGSVVPLHRSSATISEIAPLSLYLKHIVNKNSFLIIEEPEAHLHPANQLVLAKYLVRLVRNGANILITTHSVFLLEKLAKYMMASNLEPKQRPKYLGYGQDDFLTQGEVSAYLFERCSDGGHRTKQVERDKEYGISQEEFIRVTEELHRETIIINSKMQANGNA